MDTQSGTSFGSAPHTSPPAESRNSRLLTNVTKYAAASQASIAVEQENGHLKVEVADDGVGGVKPELGTGLRGLMARLESIDGHLDVESEPGGGTAVRATIPCE